MIRIASNISSLNARRELDRSTTALAKSFQRLGSGSRINHAVDDPAGLAVASSLKANSRLYAQALRNVNDGVSMLNVAEGALQELTRVNTRLQELSEQAANGVYSSKQRQALDAEAAALTNEYNRVISTTSYNGIRLFGGTTPMGVSLQVGPSGGTNDMLTLSLGSGLTSSDSSTRTTGTGMDFLCIYLGRSWRQSESYMGRYR